MTYERFEDLPVWRDAIELAARVLALTDAPGLRLPSGFRDQIERAVVSISNNIAEGYERNTNGELIQFLYIARGSAGEVRSMLCLLERLDGDRAARPAIADLKDRSSSISRQLGAWTRQLRNSAMTGPRTLTDADREAAERARRAEAMDAKLKRYQDEAVRKSATRRDPPVAEAGSAAT